MRFRVLGPFEVWTDEGAVPLRAAKPRAVLAALLLRANAVVSTDELHAVIWGDDPPATAAKTLQTYVSRLRRHLGDERIVTSPHGYSLHASPDEIDATQFQVLASARRFDDALALWRGRPYGEFADHPFARVEVRRLEELRLTLIEDRAQAHLETGLAAQAVGDLDSLTVEHPLRERAWALLMRALYASGRQADALRAYQRARHVLAEDLGIDPGPELQALERAILAHDQSLEPRSPSTILEPAVPPVMYARTVDGVHVAYQVVGRADADLIIVPPMASNLEAVWSDPEHADAFRRLSEFNRLILFDKRGTGLSDPLPPVEHFPTLEQRADDIRAVLDGAGSARATLFGIAEGGTVAAFYAATHPERVTALVLFNASARFMVDDDYPCGLTVEQADAFLRHIERRWGSGAMVPFVAPGLASSPAQMERLGRLERLSASPAGAVAAQRINFDLDIRAFLSAIRVPTLLLSEAEAWWAPHMDYLARHVPGSRLVQIPGPPSIGQLAPRTIDIIEDFLSGSLPPPSLDRVLVTVVSSSVHSEPTVREDYARLVDRQIERFRGNAVRSGGETTRATFDGPARAIAYSSAIVEGGRRLGAQVRVGVHTGEVDVVSGTIAGIAADIAEQICGVAAPGELLVSRTVVDLVAGAGFAFDDRGHYDLPGVAGRWRVFAVHD